MPIKSILIEVTPDEAESLAKNLNVAVKAQGICVASAAAFNFVDKLQKALSAGPTPENVIEIPLVPPSK